MAAIRFYYINNICRTFTMCQMCAKQFMRIISFDTFETLKAL